MLRIGLSSSALLTRDLRAVLDAAKGAGVDAVEWAGDVHVPHDDPAAAQAAMMDTLRSGLTVASYATLYRASAEGEAGLRFERVLDAAAALQAPLVRVYLGPAPRAGGRRPAARDGERLAAEARRLGDLAAARGLTLCLSFGRNTSLDSYPAALALVERIDHPFVRLAWEPLQGVPSAEASAALEACAPRLSMLVARRLDRDGAPLSLAGEADAWRRRLAAFSAAQADPKMGSFVVIGAVRDGAGRVGASLPGLAEDVALLRGIIGELEAPGR